jgi:hypothetical protein
MSNRLQIPRTTGTAYQTTALLAGEVLIDTPNQRLVIGDGSEVGGIPLAQKAEVDAKADAVDVATGLALKQDTAPLIATSGAGLVGYSPAVSSWPANTVGAKLLKVLSINKVNGAVADGVTDDSGVFAAADAIGPFTVPTGTYKIGVNTTFANQVTFPKGARIVIPAGVTVTFNGGIEAGEYQIFNLTSTTTSVVTGLSMAKQAWWDGDIATRPGATTSTTTCEPYLQAAFNAVNDNGILFGDPKWRRWGTAQVGATCSYDGRGARYFWNSSTTNGFNAMASTARTTFGNFSFEPLTPGTIPTAGIALLAGRSYVKYSNITTADAYIGIDARAGVGCYFSELFISGTLSYGIRVQSIDQYFQGGIVASLNDWITLSGVTGSFNAGDAITIGGSQGNIQSKYDATHFRMFINDIKPTVGMAITSSSGGSATVAAVTLGHQLGGFRLEPQNAGSPLESIVIRDMDVLGGLYSLTVVNPGGGIGRIGHLAWSRIENSVYFDTSYDGAVIDGAYGCEINAWFANSRSKNGIGAWMTNCSRCRVGGHFTANSGVGLHVDNTNVNNTIDRADFDGNTRNMVTPSVGFNSELLIGSALNRITITNIFVGFTSGASGVVPPYGLFVAGGAGDYVWADNVQAPAGKIFWGATGSHNRRQAVGDLADL